MASNYNHQATSLMGHPQMYDDSLLRKRTSLLVSGLLLCFIIAIAALVISVMLLLKDEDATIISLNKSNQVSVETDLKAQVEEVLANNKEFVKWLEECKKKNAALDIRKAVGMEGASDPQSDDFPEKESNPDYDDFHIDEEDQDDQLVHSVSSHDIGHASSPEEVSSHDHERENSHEGVAPHDNDLANSPEDMSSHDHGHANPTEDMVPHNHEHASSPEDVSSHDHDYANSPGDVSSHDHDDASSSEDMVSHDHDDTSISEDVDSYNHDQVNATKDMVSQDHDHTSSNEDTVSHQDHDHSSSNEDTASQGHDHSGRAQHPGYVPPQVPSREGISVEQTAATPKLDVELTVKAPCDDELCLSEEGSGSGFILEDPSVFYNAPVDDILNLEGSGYFLTDDCEEFPRPTCPEGFKICETNDPCPIFVCCLDFDI